VTTETTSAATAATPRCVVEPVLVATATSTPNEECDDAELRNDGRRSCDAACRVEPYCGDGALDCGEECDDGNNNNGDGCDAECTVEPYCGDGVCGRGRGVRRLQQRQLGDR
jgi:cysteine-rich repeat protein